MNTTRTVHQKQDNEVSVSLDEISIEAGKLYNEANYLIRNIRSAMYKASKCSGITEKEETLLLKTRLTLVTIKENDERRYQKKVKSAIKKGGSASDVEKEPSQEDISYGNMSFVYVYEFLDKYMKDTKNVHYKSLPSHVSQQVLRKLAKDWKSYFKSVKAYRENPSKFTGCPRPPKYKKDGCTVTYTTQSSFLHFIGEDVFLSFTGINGFINIGKSKDFKDRKYVRSEFIKKNGRYKLCATFDNGTKEIKIPRTVKRAMGIDLGINNFLACFSNVPEMPALLYKGKYIKSINQYFNKVRAKILSSMTKGRKTEKAAISKRLDRISIKREDFFRDFFYKISHNLCRLCVQYGIQVIIIGSNSNWKQESDMGRTANQNFITIPYDKFKNALKCVAMDYGIAVVTREESYTSQASLADKDYIPTYGEDDDKDKFTGMRSKKAYTLADGKIVNADINGAGNILRKQYPKLFKSLKREELIKMMENIQTVDMKDIYKGMKQQPGIRYKKHVSAKCQMHKNERYAKKIFYRDIFKSKTLNGIEGMCLSCKVAA